MVGIGKLRNSPFSYKVITHEVMSMRSVDSIFTLRVKEDIAEYFWYMKINDYDY